jgi:hypothetical protein
LAHPTVLSEKSDKSREREAETRIFDRAESLVWHDPEWFGENGARTRSQEVAAEEEAFRLSHHELPES